MSTATLSNNDSLPKKSAHRSDPYIWGSYIALLIVSIIELFSASSQEIRVGHIYDPIMRHVMFLFIGLVMMLIIERLHFIWLYYIIPFYVGASIITMILVMFVGTNVNGAARAIEIGSIMILPAEFLKLAVALGIAWILSRTQIRNADGSHGVSNAGVIASAVLVVICSLLLFSQGLTNTLLLMTISVGMMLVGGIGWRKLGKVLLVYLALGAMGIGAKALMGSNEKITAEDVELAQINQTNPEASTDKHNRWHTWKARVERHFRLNKTGDEITDENKQEQLSFIAQARGGLTGTGIGHSRENSRLPLAFSDYIYAIIVEELGALAAILVMVFYLFLLGRAGRLAMQFQSTLPTLLVIGCALVICSQALFHICIVTGVFPVSGQPLPLISKGGTSILATSLALGVMLSASRWAARKSDDDEARNNELSTLPEEIANDNPSQI